MPGEQSVLGRMLPTVQLLHRRRARRNTAGVRRSADEAERDSRPGPQVLTRQQNLRQFQTY